MKQTIFCQPIAGNGWGENWIHSLVTTCESRTYPYKHAYHPETIEYILLSQLVSHEHMSHEHIRG